MRIDAHQHFWDIESGHYDWPTEQHGPIYRTFRPSDLAPLLTSAGVDRTVCVQTVNTIRDTDAMLDAADEHPFIAGVVGWLPLEDPAGLEQEAARWGGRPLCGIRHLIHHEADPDWVVRPTVVDGLRRAAALGLAFDVVAVFPRHLRHVPVIADAVPELTIVIDHLANPPIRNDGWERWREELAAAAARPNVFAKLSGLDTAAGPGWTRRELAPAVDVALEAFGAERLLFGSDWPVCLVQSSYDEVVSAARQLTAALSPTERDAVFGGTARRVYRLRSG
jgi:L-fuconolactonase